MKYTTENLEATYELAKKFIYELTRSASRGACVVLLEGDLGSGKTSFVQGVARALGVEEPVTSPTFVVMKKYILPGGGKWQELVHVDAYRLSPEERSESLGLGDVFKDPKAVVLIEWPTHLNVQYPEDCVQLSFRFVSENVREITLPERM